MDDNQKWLQAAAGIEEDISYLKAAMASGLWNFSSRLDQDIQHLKTVLSIYQKNAAKGVSWPQADDLFCIHALPRNNQHSTATRKSFKTAF
jgi:hypothetical protein